MAYNKESKFRSEEDSARMSKRLCYVLRYGAEKEGVNLHEGGYVDLEELLNIPIFRKYRRELIIDEINMSNSHRGMPRFETKYENRRTYVRATYGRRFIKSPYHDGTQVKKLTETCIDHVLDNLNMYEMEGFQDEFIINSMIHKLRHQNKLSSKAMKCLLCSTIEHLDLGCAYITESTLRLVGQRCPHIKVLNLRQCDYVVTDHAMLQLLKKLTQLESLNLAGCKYITDKTIDSLCKNCKQLKLVNLSGIPDISETALLKLVTNCVHLEHVDIYDNGNISAEYRETLAEICSKRNICIVLKQFHLDNADKGLSLQLASVGNSW